MLEFGGSVYYVDLDALDKAITVHDGNSPPIIEREKKEILDENGKVINTEIFERTIQQVKEIDAPKYDVIKTFIEYIIDSVEETDDTLGADRALQSTGLGYKIVFNTLLNEGIIKEK